MHQVPAGPAVLPRAHCAPPRVPRWRSCTSTSSRQQGQAQAITTLGGAVHHPRGALTRDLQDPVRGQEGRLQRVEHRTPAPVLSLSNCSNLVHQYRCCTACSHAFEFTNLSSAVCISLQQRLGMSSESLCTSAKMLSAQGLPRARCPPPIFYDFFKKI
jgi:hypothetical protein